MRFSQRVGINPPEKILQLDSIDEDLRNGLWNTLTVIYWNSYRRPNHHPINRTDFIDGSNFENSVKILWIHYFKEPIDTMDRYWGDCLKVIRAYFYSAKWWEVYDFIEFVAETWDESKKENFIKICNKQFQRENSGYRFVDGRIVEITSKEEIESIEAAMERSIPYGGVREHLSRSLTLQSDRHNPDYRNSIKESISSVESLAKQIAQKDNATLGAILKQLENERKIHPALKSAFSSLYGYTNDADGIRHALLDQEQLSKADARFMLICCSAFVNYVIETIG